jgi:hypothetical protein
MKSLLDNQLRAEIKSMIAGTFSGTVPSIIDHFEGGICPQSWLPCTIRF